jgi:hypothetical protein
LGRTAPEIAEAQRGVIRGVCVGRIIKELWWSNIHYSADGSETSFWASHFEFAAIEWRPFFRQRIELRTLFCSCPSACDINLDVA